MRHFVLAAFLTALIALTGCTSTRVVESSESASAYAEVNERAEQRTARLLLADGRTVKAAGLQVAADSASYFDAGGQVHAVATGEIERVTFVRRGRGALQGAGLGAAIGFGAGFVLGVATDKRDCETFGDENCDFFQSTPAENGVLLGVVLGALGGLVGLPVGTAMGSKRVYRFAPDEQLLTGERVIPAAPESAPE